MGHRANLVLVEGAGYQLFYSHWCAIRLTTDLFWGPEHAVKFVRMQRPVDRETGWQDDVFAEGGAVVDLNRKHLLFFGGEDVLSDVPLRRAYLELLARTWPGWTVEWACEGIADLAAYVGRPRESVLNSREYDASSGRLQPPRDEHKRHTRLVGSARLPDGTVRLYPLLGDITYYLACGEKLVDAVGPTTGLPRLSLQDWTSSFPGGGFHLDLARRQLGFWKASEAPGIVQRLTSRWPDWDLRWHGDLFESQLEQTDGLLQFPQPDRSGLLDRCRSMLLMEWATSPVDMIKQQIEEGRSQGHMVIANPAALRDDRLTLGAAERAAIFDRARSAL
jgi:hypothetical protein